jgi:site-specific recombinase XerD
MPGQNGNNPPVARTAIEKGIAKFVRALKERNASPHTIHAYTHDLGEFVRYLGAESDDLQTPAVVTATCAYFRLRRSDYAAEDRRRMAAEIRRRLDETGDIYAFYKHEERPESPLHARELLQAVSGESSAVA